jgi:hypothetical protein
MFSPIREGRSWSSYESGQRPLRRRPRVGALSGAAALAAVVGLALPAGALGSFRYEPAAGYTGSDSFSYTVSDGQGGWNVATVTITVKAAAAGGGA